MSCEGGTHAYSVNLSSGQILFADPTLCWTPNDFPNMPSSLLSLTASGTIVDGNISTITLTNKIVYEAFDPPELYSNFKKPLQIDESGTITYSDIRVGLVSSYSGAFSNAISAFTPSSIGGADIQDITSTNPDTLTNAVGKLDAWITNSFLVQPPAVTQSVVESTSLYAGVQWKNFMTYAVMDKFIPYVTSIIFIIGDPANDFCTFELFDTNYFPYRNYTDGISPFYTPLVRLRAFRDFFTLTGNIKYLTKTAMTAQCIRIIDSSGYTFPDTGYVLGLENTDGATTYTTMNIFIPTLPVDTDIPVRIIYLNNTMQQTNIFSTIVQITSVGPPSAPLLSPYTPFVLTPRLFPAVDYPSDDVTTLSFEVTQPYYSDSVAQISLPYFSSYITTYTASALTTSVNGQGFRYGVPNPQTIPPYLSDYSITLYSTFSKFTSSVQVITVVGDPITPILPGVVWSTSVAAVNLANIIGPQSQGIQLASAFPPVIAPNISSIHITAIARDQIQYARTSTIFNLQSYNNGWSVGDYASTDVVFLSTISPVEFQLVNVVQFNDPAYPGDRNTLQTNSVYTDENSNITALSLPITPIADDFPLDTLLGVNIGPNTLFTTISDSYTAEPYQKFFYNAAISEVQDVEGISLIPKQIFFSLENNNATTSQIYSTPTYTFQTELITNDALVSSIGFYNTITSTTQVAGMYTPTTSSIVSFDIFGSNFAYTMVSSCFANAQLLKDNIIIGPQSNYSQNVYIYNPAHDTLAAEEITTTPFPMDTLLSISSCQLQFYNNVYQSPNSTKPVSVRIQLQSAAPQTSRGFVSTILDSTLFVDTVSLNTYTTFNDTMGANGLRIVSLLPATTIVDISENNIQDFVDIYGKTGPGLATTTSTFFHVDEDSFDYTISSCAIYTHTSSLSSIWSNFYSRELLYTNAKFIHTAGFNFNQYSGIPLGIPDAVYPDFTYDLVYDQNKGYRYASFTYESPLHLDPVSYQFAYVRIVNPSHVSTIVEDPTKNIFFPNDAVPAYFMSSINVRIHLKTFGYYNEGATTHFESEWVNCLNLVDNSMFNDDVFDEPACIEGTVSGNDIVYKVQLARRNYIKICSIVRVGLAHGCSMYCGTDISFEAVHVELRDE